MISCAVKLYETLSLLSKDLTDWFDVWYIESRLCILPDSITLKAVSIGTHVSYLTLNIPWYDDWYTVRVRFDHLKCERTIDVEGVSLSE